MTIEQIHQLFLECSSVCTDTRKLEKKALFFALKGANFNGNKFATKALDQGAKYAIIDEKEYESAHTILVSNALETLQELAQFHRHYLKIPIIAITGSNGKTTTKELINAVLSKTYKTTATIGNLNNHIGVPLTLLSMNSDTEIGIVEMGANHQKEIAFLCNIAQPDFGYITNFGKAHLEGFGSIDGVIKGKSELYNYLIKYNGTIFVNTQDRIQVEKSKTANAYTFGDSTDNDVTIKFIEAHPFVKVRYNTKSIESHLIGDYNFNNIAAAITLGTYFKVPDNLIEEAIKNYIPSNNRSQIITKDSTKIILDAYNANPSSMSAALSNFEKLKGPKVVILGDMFELGQDAEKEHQTIADLATELTINSVILIGENFFKIASTSSKLKVFKSFEDAQQKITDSDFSNTSILIKGSRGMALERVLDLLD